MAVEAGSSYEDWRLKEDFSKIFSKKFGSSKIKRTFATPFEKRVLERGFRKFIEKTVLLYKKQVPRKYNLSRSVNFFGNYKCQDKLRDIKNYTMKSLILAQDER